VEEEEVEEEKEQEILLIGNGCEERASTPLLIG
jgi:hypothetical protein